MKSLVQISAIVLALSAAPSVLAQEVTQAEKNGSAGLVTQCISSKAPANWGSTMTAIDRSNPAQSVIYNVARTAKSNQLVDIDVKGCNIAQQVTDLLQFATIIPATEKNWKILYLFNDVKKQYFVITDLGLAKLTKK